MYSVRCCVYAIRNTWEWYSNQMVQFATCDAAILEDSPHPDVVSDPHSSLRDTTNVSKLSVGNAEGTLALRPHPLQGVSRFEVNTGFLGKSTRRKYNTGERETDLMPSKLDITMPYPQDPRLLRASNNQVAACSFLAQDSP